METPLIILYTHRLRGEIELLPRLYSFQRQLKAYYTSEDVVQVCALDPAQAPGRVLLLDLGESCTADVWHCGVTNGRSTLVLLDGMGYEAARVSDAPALRAQMGDGVRLALVDEAHPHKVEDVVIAAGAVPEAHNLTIQLVAGEITRLEGSRLQLAALSGSDQVGAALLTRGIDGWALAALETHTLPRRTLPDPTIAASVEFVISEARYAQKRRAR